MKGVGELLHIYNDNVTLTPKGVLGFMSKGLAGTKTIPFASITAIQFRKAGALISGYIQFTIPGGNESKRGVLDAASDENTFMFAGKENNEMASEIKEFIESSMRTVKASRSSIPPASLAEELQKLALLKEQGILSDEEFQAAKSKLIG